ncbi:3-deoxy-D-manno-octulosonic acid transferase [Tunturiibacter lichenicola]|uniref:3-deoxy-D-manno-octulosonic acid transferase n=1 Tax=Tunturiibacter lichenicola TaxID=2051959 RepID=UPI0028C4DDD5|nr:3-deoxy-D-manno-octulosonic acid transferase [Edaphobacter lichenicola]
MMVVYSSLLLAVLVVGAPYWLVRMATSGRYRAGLRGRLGLVPAGLRAAVAGQRVIWVHAVSVGEVMAATQLIRELKAALPGWVVAVSTTTETGQRLAKDRLAESPVFYLPLDFKFAVRRYLRVLQPKMLVLMESELWPRLIEECAKSGVPVAVVNARVSDRSFPRYMRLRRLWRPFLGMISLFLAQSKETAERLVKIGAPAERVKVTGNLKYDVRVGTESALTKMLRSALPVGARVIVCGSTLDGEETILLEAWPALLAKEPNAVMVLAPRHPDRFSAVAGIITANNFMFVRASKFHEENVGKLTTSAWKAGSIFLLDTIGDLASMYGLGSVAFVGGSLVAAGGHNPLEPAQFGVPVLMGPSFQNFREVVETMRDANALRIVSAMEVSAELTKLLQDADEAKALGERGRAVFEAQAGATARTGQLLMPLLEETSVTTR